MAAASGVLSDSQIFDAAPVVDGPIVVQSAPSTDGVRSSSSIRKSGSFFTNKPSAALDAMLGLVLVLISTVLFSVMSYCVSEIGMDVPVLQTATVRFWAQGLLTLVTIPLDPKRRGRLSDVTVWLGKPENRLKLMLRGSWGIFGLSCYFATLQALDIADATAIVYVNIPLTALFARLILHEAYTWVDAGTALLAFVGVVFVAQPPALFGGTAAPVPLPSLGIALFGSCCSAMAYVTIRSIGKSEDSLVIVLWFSVLGATVVPLLCLALQRFIPWPSTRILWLELGTGFFGWAGQIALNAGMQRAPIGPAAAMRYADIIWSILIQTVLQGRSAPNSLKLLGCALVMSTLASTLYKSRKKMVADRAEEIKEAAARSSPSTTQGSGSSLGEPSVPAANSSSSSSSSSKAGELDPLYTSPSSSSSPSVSASVVEDWTQPIHVHAQAAPR